eukprot:g27084.t1
MGRLGIPVQAQAYPSLRCGCRGWSRPAAPSISSICVLGGAAARGSSRGSRDARRRSHPAATRRRAEGAQAVKVKGEKDEVEPEPFFEEVSGDDPLVLELEARLKQMNDDKSLTLLRTWKKWGVHFSKGRMKKKGPKEDAQMLRLPKVAGL